MAPKSGYSRTKAVGYDDDDDIYDDDSYDEGGDGGAYGEDADDGVDKEQMRVGTIRVREMLGDMSSFVTDSQIEDALWHYYYDADKSVSYLKNKIQPTTPEPKQKAPKAKAVSRFDQAASAAQEKTPTVTGKSTHSTTMAESAYPAFQIPPLSIDDAPYKSATRDFFADVPWGNVPSERLGVITTISPPYRGGLLGGSSKLAALAAKRKKEREEAEAAAANKAQSETSAAIAILDKLAISGSETSKPRPQGGEEGTRAGRPKYQARKRSPSPQPEQPKEEEKPEEPRPALVHELPAQRARPSMFASTLCGPGSSLKPDSTEAIFPVPYTQYKDFDSTKAFAGPSPDDIVYAAQKGAAGGRR